MPDEMVAFPKVRLLPKPGQSLRPGTLIRMSLVDIRSSSENIIDHWHRLVDCREEVLSPRWSVVRPLELPYGWVTFSNLGVVRSLERDRGREVGERAVVRAEERIGIGVRSDRHQQLELRDRAEARCRETCAFRLKICFEAFLKAEDGTIVQVGLPDILTMKIQAKFLPKRIAQMVLVSLVTSSEKSDHQPDLDR